MEQKISIIGVPMDFGQLHRGVDMGPAAVRYSRLVPRLRSLGLNVEDRGDVNVPVRDTFEGDGVQDYTKEIAIVPISAKTKEGLPELLMLITGVAQKYLEQNLHIVTDSPAKGTILEVKEEKGLGITMDVIVYDGTLKVNDHIVIGALDKPIETKVRALFEPMPLAEMRDTKSKFKPVKEVKAAIGVKIAAPNIDNVVAGMPLQVTTPETVEQIKKDIQSQIEDVMIETEEE